MNVKRCLAVTSIAFALVFAVRAQAQDVTPADKEKALKYLESTKKNIEDATKGLSEAQWNFKPAPDRWSVAEVMEHIAATEDRLQGLIVTQVMKAPAAPDLAAEWAALARARLLAPKAKRQKFFRSINEEINILLK